MKRHAERRRAIKRWPAADFPEIISNKYKLNHCLKSDSASFKNVYDIFLM